MTKQKVQFNTNTSLLFKKEQHSFHLVDNSLHKLSIFTSFEKYSTRYNWHPVLLWIPDFVNSLDVKLIVWYAGAFVSLFFFRYVLTWIPEYTIYLKKKIFARTPLKGESPTVIWSPLRGAFNATIKKLSNHKHFWFICFFILFHGIALAYFLFFCNGPIAMTFKASVFYSFVMYAILFIWHFAIYYLIGSEYEWLLRNWGFNFDTPYYKWYRVLPKQYQRALRVIGWLHFFLLIRFAGF